MAHPLVATVPGRVTTAPNVGDFVQAGEVFVVIDPRETSYYLLNLLKPIELVLEWAGCRGNGRGPGVGDGCGVSDPAG